MFINITMENWMRNKRLFQLTSGPRGKYVYHRSPSGRKVTRNVPNSVITKNDAMRYLMATPRPAPTPGGQKFLVVGGRKIPHAPAQPPQALDCSSLSQLTGVKKIGSGRQGVIYAANRRPGYIIREIAIKVSPFDKSAERRGEVQPSQVEWDIQKVVQRVAGGGVLSAMKFVECKDFVPISNMNNINKIGKNIDPHRQAVLFMDRADGGSLNKWIEANAARLKDGDILKIINKVLITLHRIMKKYPEFRHNDLHLDNILMNKGSPQIADFGWSRIEKSGTNPAVNTALANGTAARYGIGPDTSSRYDMHLFLNELRRFMKKMGKFPGAVKFLEKYIPVGYREFSDVYTTEGRLKYGTPLPGLPNIRTILKDPEMKWQKGTPSPARKAPSPARKAPSPARKAPSPARKAPSPARKAPSPARKAPSPAKNFSNENLAKISPRSFMKLSPGSRARVAAIRKAAKARNNTRMKNVAKAKNNATAKRMPSPRRLEKPTTRISPRILRSAKFNRLVASFLNLSNSAPYQNRWNAARAKALSTLNNRVRAGKPAFSPSPVAPPAPRRPSPVAPPRRPSPVAPPARRSPAGVVKSAGSGRFKLTGPSGRLVYANGSTISMNFLKGLAASKGVGITGLRTKDAIARAIFNRK
jgi:hypothetical protein